MPKQASVAAVVLIGSEEGTKPVRVSNGQPTAIENGALPPPGAGLLSTMFRDPIVRKFVGRRAKLIDVDVQEVIPTGAPFLVKVV